MNAARNKPDANELELAWSLFGRHSIYNFARKTEVISEELIDALLARMEEEQPRNQNALFLRAAFDAADSRGSWRAAVNALKACGAFYTWGSKPKRERLTAIANSPRLLAAVQTAAVGADEVDDEFLAILAIDGSDTSLDALYPHFSAAMKDPTRLDSLDRLSTFAKDTPALRQLLSRAKELLEGRKASGPSLTLAKQLGIATAGRFRVHVRGAGPPRDETSFDILLDSESADDFRVWVFLKGRRTTFSSRALQFDDLDAGRCELADLPRWLADRQRTLATKWRMEAIWTSYLRGKRLQLFLDWLLGPSRPSAVD